MLRNQTERSIPWIRKIGTTKHIKSLTGIALAGAQSGHSAQCGDADAD